MGSVAKALGLGSEFEFKGQTWKLSPWTYKIQGELERYLEGEAVKAARRMAQFLSEEERKELMSQVNKDIVAGVYSFGSQLVLDAVHRNPTHFKYLLFLMLRGNHPNVTLEQVNEMFEEEMELVYTKMAEANADPTTRETPPKEVKAVPESP